MFLREKTEHSQKYNRTLTFFIQLTLTFLHLQTVSQIVDVFHVECELSTYLYTFTINQNQFMMIRGLGITVWSWGTIFRVFARKNGTLANECSANAIYEEISLIYEQISLIYVSVPLRLWDRDDVILIFKFSLTFSSSMSRSDSPFNSRDLDSSLFLRRR